MITYGSAPGETPQLWTYYGDILRIHDGDTFAVNLDMGCFIWRNNIDVRVSGINAPELALQAGKDALAFAETLLSVGQRVKLVSVDGKFFEKYGRLLAKVYFLDPTGIEQNFGDVMVNSGHAVVYNP